MVGWSQRARDDLKAIHDYIAKDAPFNAKGVVRRIVLRASQLKATSKIGCLVPELGDGLTREVPVDSWRVIYQQRDDDVFIIAIIHKRRFPDTVQFRP